MQHLRITLAIGTLASAGLLLGGCATHNTPKTGYHHYTHHYNQTTPTTTHSHKTVHHASTYQQDSDANKPSDVKIYYSNKWLPKHYTVVKQITVKNPLKNSLSLSQETISSELQKAAAVLGANGVIHVKKGKTQTTGTAILIK